MRYKSRQPENSTDRFVSDFFHSRVFKVVSTLVGLLVCFFCSSFLCVFLGFGHSLLTAFTGISKSISDSANVPFPSIEPLPTYQIQITNSSLPTLETSHVESRWVKSTMDLYHLQFEMPEDWALEEINRRQVPEDPIDPNNKNMIVCAEYRITSPDRKQIITISQPCGSGEGFGEPCPDNIVIVKDLGNDNYLYREPNQERNSFYYGTTHLGPVEGTDPLYVGYWCTNPPFTTVEYQIIGKTIWDIQDFSVADQITASFLTGK